jgi:hypothetical protein
LRFPLIEFSLMLQQFRPVRLAGVEFDGDGLASARSSIAPFDASQKPFDLPLNADQSVLASVIAEQVDSEDRDETGAYAAR